MNQAHTATNSETKISEPIDCFFLISSIKKKKKKCVILIFLYVLYGYCVVLYVLGTKRISNKTMSEPESLNYLQFPFLNLIHKVFHNNLVSTV